MKIFGNTVGTTEKRTDWNQTDPVKADYLKGRDALQNFISKSVKAGDDAIRREVNQSIQSVRVDITSLRNDSVLKSGSEMTGNLGMSGNRVTGLGEPVDAGDAASKAYVDGKRVTMTAEVSATWSGSSAPYTQSVSVSGILASDLPHIMPVYSTTNATAIAQKEAWACVSEAVAEEGKITFTCFEDKPGVAIPIQIEVIR